MLNYLSDVNLHHPVMRLEHNVVMFFQTTDSPDDLLQKRMVVLKGILISEEIYLTELETLLMVICSDSQTVLNLTFICQWTFLDRKYSYINIHI